MGSAYSHHSLRHKHLVTLRKTPNTEREHLFYTLTSALKKDLIPVSVSVAHVYLFYILSSVNVARNGPA